MSFQNKVVLITGGNAGIGAATAELFAKEAATIIIVGRNKENLVKVKLICEKLGATVAAIKADITKDEEAQATIRETIEKFGKIDVLINNAGLLRKTGILEANFMDTYDLIMNLNMRAVAHMTHLAAPYLVKTKGNIVNISSAGGKGGRWPDFASYRTSKAALNHFTKCIALELSPYGVRVNAVSPGPVPTDIYGIAGLPDPTTSDFLKQMTILGKAATAEEVANIIIFLASNKAGSVTGSNYVIDNGHLIK